MSTAGSLSGLLVLSTQLLLLRLVPSPCPSLFLSGSPEASRTQSQWAPVIREGGTCCPSCQSLTVSLQILTRRGQRTKFLPCFQPTSYETALQAEARFQCCKRPSMFPVRFRDACAFSFSALHYIHLFPEKP